MQSETIGALAAALAKAQGAIKPAVMDRDNPFFKSRYATLTSLWESARSALAANGLAVTQATDFDGEGRIVLVTTLMHSSGEWVGSIYPVDPADRKPQSLGSAITYARRYAFGALVGLSADDDDDGEIATHGAQKAAPAQPSKKEAQKPAADASAPTTSAQATGKAVNGNGGGNVTQAMKAFHAAGAKLYGETWDAKRHEIVRAYTKGRTESSKELTPDELAFLTARMDAKLQEELAAVNMADVPEMEPA